MYRRKVNLIKCLSKCFDQWFNGVPQPTETLKFIKGFKFQVVEDYIIYIKDLDINIECDVIDEFYEFHKNGTLILKRGFAWDGPSGPTFDSRCGYVPSAVHDVLYRMIRHGHLPLSFKPYADKVFYELLLQFNMCFIRAYIWYLGVVWFGMDSCITPKRIIQVVKKEKS